MSLPELSIPRSHIWHNGTLINLDAVIRIQPKQTRIYSITKKSSKTNTSLLKSVFKEDKFTMNTSEGPIKIFEYFAIYMGWRGQNTPDDIYVYKDSPNYKDVEAYLLYHGWNGSYLITDAISSTTPSPW